MICEYKNYILDLIDGKLNDKKTKDLREHSKKCIQCLTKLKELENVDAMIKNELIRFPYRSSKDKIIERTSRKSCMIILLSRLYTFRKYAYSAVIIIFIMFSVHYFYPLLNNVKQTIRNASNDVMNNNSDKPYLDAVTLKKLGFTIKDGSPESSKISKQEAINIANKSSKLNELAKKVSAQYNLIVDSSGDIPVWIVCYQGVSPTVKGGMFPAMVKPNRFTVIIVDAISGKVLSTASSSAM